MFYEEKLVNGVLCSRSSPKEEFTPKTPKELTTLLLRARDSLGDANKEMTELIQDLNESGLDWQKYVLDRDWET